MDPEHYGDFGDWQGGESSSEGICPVPSIALPTTQEFSIRVLVTQGAKALLKIRVSHSPTLGEILTHLRTLTNDPTPHPGQIFVCRGNVDEPVRDIDAFLPFFEDDLVWVKVVVERGMPEQVADTDVIRR